jgi:hypothetical protein
MGHEDQFAPPGPSGRYRFGQATFTGTHGNERDAPIADLHTLAPERGGSTFKNILTHVCGRWGYRGAVIRAGTFGPAGRPAHVSSSSSALASLRSGVSKPSVNQP